MSLPVRLLAAYAALCSVGCEAVIGLGDYSFEDAGRPWGDAPQAVAEEDAGDKTQRCRQFCERTDSTCRPAPEGSLSLDDDYQIYRSREECQAACELLAPSQISCREAQVVAAAQTIEYFAHCQAASLGGSAACGGNCENYCALMDAVCTGDNRDRAESEGCLNKCEALRDREWAPLGLPVMISRYGATRDETGDTLQCRLVHLTRAATPDRASAECWQAGLSPHSGPQGEPNPCSARRPNCEDYCQIAVHGCSGDHQLYESTPQCAAVCARLEPGAVGELKGDTIGCRTAHAYNGLITDPLHCSHGGPGGAGACGDDCVSYCRLFAAGCGTKFDELFGDADDPAEACRANCRAVHGNGWLAYSTALGRDPNGPPLACQLLYAARALEKPQRSAALCESAAGELDCRR